MESSRSQIVHKRNLTEAGTVYPAHGKKSLGCLLEWEADDRN